MIELNKKTQQDFLNREWVQKLLDAGVDMSDAKYRIITVSKTGMAYIILSTRLHEREDWLDKITDNIPTYTVSELLYKLHEYIYPTIDGKEFSGCLTMLKDAPFYMFYYKLRSKEYDLNKTYASQPKEWNEDYLYAEFEYPIESLASLLIQCHKKDIGIARKDTGDISDK